MPDKPFGFGAFSEDHSHEQEKGIQRPIFQWLRAGYDVAIEAGFTPEQAMQLIMSRNRMIMRQILSNLKKNDE